MANEAIEQFKADFSRMPLVEKMAVVVELTELLEQFAKKVQTEQQILLTINN